MKWLHMADLHLGRRLDNNDLIPDQRDMLNQILRIAQAERPDGALIAGDVYDRSVPPAAAVTLLDDFLTQLSAVCPVFIISGNHDSGERLAFAQALLARQQVYVCGGYDGQLTPVTLGDTDVYMLPHIHPAEVRAAHPEEDVHTMHDAIRVIIDHCAHGSGRRRILLAHLFVTSGGALPEQSRSEVSPIGTLEHVDASLFDGFDYVALGHIHGPQRVGRETVRYAGSPLPYSFSEEHHHKSVTIWEPGAAQPVRQLPVHPLRAMRRLTGTLDQLLDPNADNRNHDDFIAADLLDVTPQLDAAARLRQVYPNLVQVSYLNRADVETLADHIADVEELQPGELFARFYQLKTGDSMTAQQCGLIEALLAQAQKEESQP